MRLLFMNGRHWKIMLVITMQYPLGIPPNLRTNIDYVFILREPYITNRKRIYDNYAGMFPTFESFCQVMDQCTENYECLVINNNAKKVIAGDVLFNGSIGRTDLPQGNHKDLIDSIHKHLLVLDDSFTVHCGHGPDTTIGHERKTNPFLNA